MVAVLSFMLGLSCSSICTAESFCLWSECCRNKVCLRFFYPQAVANSKCCNFPNILFQNLSNSLRVVTKGDVFFLLNWLDCFKCCTFTCTFFFFRKVFVCVLFHTHFWFRIHTKTAFAWPLILFFFSHTGEYLGILYWAAYLYLHPQSQSTALAILPVRAAISIKVIDSSTWNEHRKYPVLLAVAPTTQLILVICVFSLLHCQVISSAVLSLSTKSR